MNFKNEVAYSKICDFIRQKAPNFIPETVILDYEIAPRNASKKRYLHAVFYGYLFHFS
jgi:hypothetical protein